jgi:hypothetical protein
VVSTSFVPLLHPAHAGPGVLERLEAACQEGGTSFYTSGIDPGFGNAGITIGALALCKEVRTVRMMEIVNYATWDNPFTMFEIMGFGKADPSESLLLSPGSTALAWGPVLELVAAAIGLDLDEIVERHEVIRPTRTSRSRRARSAAGTISGMRFEIVGMAGGEERLVVEHVTRLRDEDAPDWPQGDGYRILISGEPNVHVELSLSSDRGDHNHAGCLATAMHVINAIPAVVAAEPGVKTILETCRCTPPTRRVDALGRRRQQRDGGRRRRLVERPGGRRHPHRGRGGQLVPGPQRRGGTGVRREGRAVRGPDGRGQPDGDLRRTTGARRRRP